MNISIVLGCLLGWLLLGLLLRLHLMRIRRDEVERMAMNFRAVVDDVPDPQANPFEGLLDGRLVRLVPSGILTEQQELQYHVQLNSRGPDRRFERTCLTKRAQGSQASDARAAIERFFALRKAHSVRVEAGVLKISRSTGTTYVWSEKSLREAFRDLLVLAPLLETVELQLTSKARERLASRRSGEREREREPIPLRGWTAGGASVLCPYCRADLDEDDHALEACTHCSTAHHAECFAEAGGCTIFACAGRPLSTVEA